MSKPDKVTVYETAWTLFEIRIWKFSIRLEKNNGICALFSLAFALGGV
jgi:hypothetical protein